MKGAFVWGGLEEDILNQAVREANSVREGLHKAADILNTTFYICRNKWYIKPLKKHDEEVAITLEADVAVEAEADTVVVNLKDSLEGFLGNLSRVVEENKRLIEENSVLKRDNKMLADDFKELKESYDYILKVMDKARKLCLQDDDVPKSLKYQIKDGAIEFSA